MRTARRDSEIILNALFDGIYQIDTNRTITFWNNAAEKITGFKKDEVTGKCCADNILRHINQKGENMCDCCCPLAATLKDGQPREDIVYMHHKDGHRIPVSVRCSQIRDEKGQVKGAIEIFRDASDIQLLQQRVQTLEKLAYLDPLTELANRRYIKILIRQRLEELRRYDWHFGIFMADIDDFKKVNDTFGHQTGDMVLKSVSRTMLVNLRPFDIVARWGGEEFLGILRNIDPGLITETLNRLRMLINQSSVMHENRQVRATMSFGATMGRGKDSVDSGVERADKLMYHSKEKGKNCVTLDTADSPCLNQS